MASSLRRASGLYGAKSIVDEMVMERVMEIWYGDWMSRRKNRILLTVKYPLWDSVAASRPDRFTGIKFVCLNVRVVVDAEL